MLKRERRSVDHKCRSSSAFSYTVQFEIEYARLVLSRMQLEGPRPFKYSCSSGVIRLCNNIEAEEGAVYKNVPPENTNARRDSSGKGEKINNKENGGSERVKDRDLWLRDRFSISLDKRYGSSWSYVSSPKM